MTRSKTCKRRLHDVTSRVLVGVFIDEAICAGRGDSRCEDPLALGASPVAGFFARFESFHSTGR
jgi:hypothetical protein